jgi:hypothetical protein
MTPSDLLSGRVTKMKRPKNSSARSVLFHSLKAELFPVLVQRGFNGVDIERIIVDESESPAQAILFHFRKVFAQGQVVLTINVKSFARPTFQIIAGPVPVAGVKIWCPEELVPAERVTAEMLEKQSFLQSSPGTGYAPFRQPLWAHLVGSSAGIKNTVQHAGEVLPHLIEWIENGKSSPYVRVVKFRRPTPTA